MMTTTVANLSEDNGRIFEISVTGSTLQARLRTSTYKIRVSYSVLSQTIRSIAQRGGKIVDVKMLSMAEAEVDRIPAATELAQPMTEAVESTPAATELAQPMTEAVESIPAATELAQPIASLDVVPPVAIEQTVKPTNNRPAAARSKHSKSKKR